MDALQNMQAKMAKNEKSFKKRFDNTSGINTY